MIGLTAGGLGSVSSAVLGWTSGSLFAFAEDKVPNEAAQALSPQTGWVMLVGAIAAVTLFILHGERWRRFWLTAEDPRAIGLYRIVFGFFVICNVNDFWEYFTFLFTDEGIFTADVARQVHASAQFKGFGDGLTDEEPWGFFDFWGFVEFLKGPKWSLLYFWDSPTAFWIHLWAFEILATMFMLGLWTRLTGVLTWFLMNSIFFRNHLFWEGTELVYRVFLGYLICAKAGYAYSIDNWLRCRKLRKRGLLSERDGPGGGAGLAPDDAHPQGLQAIYRLIPAWPRRLMMFQLGTVYAYTGIVKNGSVWAKGDAIYYAWNMDHFYRYYPQRITALIGTNFLRLMAWFAHWGEVFFAVCLIGVLVHWARSEKFPPETGVRRLLLRLCWFTIVLVSGALIWVTWSVHFVPEMPSWVFVSLWISLLLALWWGWERVERKPIVIRPERAAGLVAGLVVGLGATVCGLLVLADAPHWYQWLGVLAGWLVLSVGVMLRIRAKRPSWWAAMRSFGTTQIDRLWICRWVLGRRIWIPWHLALMGGIFTLMNIGQFQTGMMSQTFIFFTGLEVAVGLRWFGRWLARRGVPFIPQDVKDGLPPLPAEDETLPHLRRDSAKLPQWALFTTAGIVLVGVLVAAVVQPQWNWQRIWWGALLFAAGVAFQQWRAARGQPLSVVDPNTGRGRTPWAYGPFGRFVVGALLIWHLVAVTVWLLPEKDSLHAWRGPARNVFALWLTRTQTDQGWGMFAPNPPRSNVFLKVLVTGQDGEVYDMKTDVYAPERKPMPWIWNDRMRKMNRRIIGGESGDTSWYRKWHARWYCRQWALDPTLVEGLSGLGVPPKKVELVKVWYKIPSPEDVRRRGFYVPEDLLARTGEEKIEYTEQCKGAIMGQLPNWIRERHGLPPLPDNEKYKPWIKHKKRAWEKAHAPKDETEDEDGDKGDPTRKLDD